MCIHAYLGTYVTSNRNRNDFEEGGGVRSKRVLSVTVDNRFFANTTRHPAVLYMRTESVYICMYTQCTFVLFIAPGSFLFSSVHV